MVSYLMLSLIIAIGPSGASQPLFFFEFLSFLGKKITLWTEINLKFEKLKFTFRKPWKQFVMEESAFQ